jgi:superfamily II DNA or RNA helicase
MNELRENTWKKVYRTGDDNLLTDFYLKALKSAVQYDRAVGYFSSELLVLASQGLSSLIKSGGRMRLIIGHPLDHEEYDAVKAGADLSWMHEEFKKKILDTLDGDNGGFSKNKLKLLTWLLACGSLEIKFALRKRGMYHEKIGTITDCVGDKITFQGSANETINAMISDNNAESISVYQSWDTEIYAGYGQPYEEGFEALWRGNQHETYTVGLPSETYEAISKAAREEGCPDLELEQIYARQNILNTKSLISTNKSQPHVPELIGGNRFSIREHQRNALESWRANNYRGIMKLATGSGKTITAIYGAVRMYEARNKLFVIIAVPYNELAGQWVENLKWFGITPHKCYDNKNNWYERFKLDVQAFALGTKTFVSAVVINKTMITEAFQEVIKNIPEDQLLFVGDECHRHGAEKTSKYLPSSKLRMGLSATPYADDDDEIETPFPDEGKKRLNDYYGAIVAEYSLSDAINDNVLTPYKYHVRVVRLTEMEQEEYEEITTKIGNLVRQGASINKAEGNETLTILCSRRSRLLGAAENKLLVLKSLISKIPEEDRQYSLFYCAEGESERNGKSSKNVDQVSLILNEYKWRVCKFTSREKTKERKSIMSSFVSGGIDALVSMKVLDEGIDIPVCKTAFILASTKNPRQYVQRRGRILRKFPGKSYANIYDFVVLPAIGYEKSSASIKLVRSEKERVNDFMLLSKNKSDVYEELQRNGIEL